MHIFDIFIDYWVSNKRGWKLRTKGDIDIKELKPVKKKLENGHDLGTHVFVKKYTKYSKRLMYTSYDCKLNPAQTQKLSLFVLVFREFYQQQVCFYIIINFKCSV